ALALPLPVGQPRPCQEQGPWRAGGRKHRPVRPRRNPSRPDRRRARELSRRPKERSPRRASRRPAASSRTVARGSAPNQAPPPPTFEGPPASHPPAPSSLLLPPQLAREAVSGTDQGRHERLPGEADALRTRRRFVEGPPNPVVGT